MANNSLLFNLKNSESTLVRTSISNVGLSRIFKVDDVVTSSEEAFQLSLLSEALAGITIQPVEVIKHKSIRDLFGVDYVGYIIEKERLDKATGQWIRLDNIKIFGILANKFLDSKVAYGQIYRYRIKSIARLTKSKIVESTVADAASDLQIFESNLILADLKKNNVLIDNSLNITNLGISSKSSNFADLSIPIGNNQTFTANSAGTTITPNTSTNNALSKKINVDLTKIKNKKIEFYSTYYESNPNKNWVYIQTVEKVPPPYPEAIKIVPDSYNKKISLYWLKPANDQRDIVAYRIYKRNKMGESWKLVTPSPLPESQPFYEDNDVQFDNFYIYALSCIDVHGMESFLSTQIGVQLNPRILFEKEEKELVWISGGGTMPNEINFVLKKFQEEKGNIIVAKKNIVLTTNTRFADTQQNFIIRIKSLDTHEVQELKINVKSLLVA
jgi:hypothetical protein